MSGPTESTVEVEVDCPDCDGSGRVPTRSGYQRTDCERCTGSGVILIPTDELGDYR